MTQIRSYTAPPRRPGALGVHSLDHYSLTVPDLAQADRFYADFGLETRARGNTLELYTHDNPHCWAALAEGKRKKLHYLSFGAFADDVEKFRARLDERAIERIDPPAGFESNGIWFRDPDGTPVELKAAEKCSPNAKSVMEYPPSPPAARNAPFRGTTAPVRPRRLAHTLLFTPDVPRAVRFYKEVLGLGVSDTAADVIAFMHGVHGSDHHMIAFVKSPAPGFHHSSWDVRSVDEIGLGAMGMADKGHVNGWGLGRHVLGSNYFHYVQDPWGSFSEYSADIDYVPVETDWQEMSHGLENSFFLWGPQPPEYFTVNTEALD
jgi:catechol 2,3-dioxygenase-like lactoylglutathione lyase family enzyme